MSRGDMTQHHGYLLEKLRIQAAAVIGLALVYFLFWGWAQPADPLGPITFLPSGNLGGLVATLVLLVIFATLGTLAVGLSRPSGMLAVLLISLAGLSLRSAPMRALLWKNLESLPGLF